MLWKLYQDKMLLSAIQYWFLEYKIAIAVRIRNYDTINYRGLEENYIYIEKYEYITWIYYINIHIIIYNIYLLNFTNRAALLHSRPRIVLYSLAEK